MSIPPIVPITPLAPLSPLAPLALTGAEKTPASGDGTQAGGTDFGKFLADALNQVNDLQQSADTASLGLASGKVQDLSTVMVALEKASLSMSMTVAVRDKVLDAYNQVMRMQM